jgi:hypothetical protein
MALAVVLLMAMTVQAGTMQIPKGTKVKMTFPAGLQISSGTMQASAPIICELAEAIEIGGITIVEAGAKGTATVVEAKKAGKGGKGGYIKIEFTSLNAKGDYALMSAESIKLTGFVESQGKNKKLLSYLFIFGLFISGSQGEIPTSGVYDAEVAESAVLESK